MKNGLKLLIKLVATLVAISAVIVSIAVFRFEIEEFFESMKEKFNGIGRGEKGAPEDEYADFADV